tara:strand:+ start:428 stop:745 length:318 start_codon:yes stop_codon:yes gene_type:complete
MSDKIDTQGMSGPAIPGGKDNNYPHDQNGEPILPRMVIHPRRLFTPEYVKEMKILINEVLDEREYQRKLRMNYDDPTPPGVSYFDTEQFKHPINEPEPDYPRHII